MKYNKLQTEKKLLNEVRIPDGFTCDDGNIPGYWASQLYKAMKGGGTDEAKIVHIVKMKCAGLVKIEFERKYPEYSLEEWIKDEFDGNDKERRMGEEILKVFNKKEQTSLEHIDLYKEKSIDLEKMAQQMEDKGLGRLVKAHGAAVEAMSDDDKINNIMATALEDPKFPYKSEYSDEDIKYVADLGKKMQKMIKELLPFRDVLANYSQLNKKLQDMKDLSGGAKEEEEEEEIDPGEQMGMQESILKEEGEEGSFSNWVGSLLKKIKDMAETMQAPEPKDFILIAADLDNVVSLLKEKLKDLLKYYKNIVTIKKNNLRGSTPDPTAAGAAGSAKSREPAAMDEEKLGDALVNLTKKIKAGTASKDEQEVFKILGF